MTGQEDDSASTCFARERPRLIGLAYRMLGSVGAAEDVVQEAWVRFQATDPGSLDRAAAWLTTVTTRLALDHLRAARRERRAYLGPWLPEPVVTRYDPAEVVELADSLSLAFLVMLEELSPLERAVLLLADVFAYPHDEIAAIVGKSPAATRQIASRARRRVRDVEPPSRSANDRAAVEDLVRALMVGDIERALTCLAPDVVVVSDSGPARRDGRRRVTGAARVARYLRTLGTRLMASPHVVVEPALINGDPGFLARLDGEPDFVVAFEARERQVAAIRVIRNRDKLARTGAPVTLV